MQTQGCRTHDVGMQRHVASDLLVIADDGSAAAQLRVLCVATGAVMELVHRRPGWMDVWGACLPHNGDRTARLDTGEGGLV